MRKPKGIHFNRGVTVERIAWLFLWPALVVLFSGLPLAQGQGNVDFIATELLGRPTDTSVTVNAVAHEAVEVFLEYGTTSGVYANTTQHYHYAAGVPIEIVIDGLDHNTRYYYRLRYRLPGTDPVLFSHTDEHSFHTQRSPDSSFTFTVQADSHLYDPKCVDQIYELTLQNELLDAPDFFFELGDTFGADKFLPPDYQTIAQLHLDQRPYLGVVGHSAPLFFVLGNHEGEVGYALNGTADNIVVYATNARKLYYPNPVPDSFYTGNSALEKFIGMPPGDPDVLGTPEDYYAWEWGDALFVVLDPYRYTTTNPKASGNEWDWTLGQAQYDWLKRTLEGSQAKFKFVFSHHLLGDVRGGVRWADKYEWGGYNKNGIWEFGQRRPEWAAPIHQLMVQNGVTIFFQGHDHLFAKEELDGIVYQTVPHPSFPTGTMPNAEYYSGDVLPASGYLRVGVSGSAVTVDYVRTYLPGEGTNGEVGYTYTIPFAAVANPEIQVLEGSTDLPDGIGKVDFGSTNVGTAVTKTFTVKNLGVGNLTLPSSISVPAGFTVSSPFGTTTVPVGSSTNFTIRLDAITAGSYSGTLSFSNNDRDENPFNITISGTVRTTTGPPLPPTNVTASDGTYRDKVQVSWTGSTGATSYTVYRSTSITNRSKKLGTASNTSFNDTTASRGVTYYYYVTASNTYGTSGLSAYDTGYRR